MPIEPAKQAAKNDAEWSEAGQLVADLERDHGTQAFVILARVYLDAEADLEKALAQRSQGYVRAKPDD